MAFVWENPPEVLWRNIRDYGDLVTTKAGRAITTESIEAQGFMTENAPWQNVSGNARRGLRVHPDHGHGQWVIYFVHSVEYGVYLELKNGGRYAIIIPAMERFAPRLRKRLAGLV